MKNLLKSFKKKRGVTLAETIVALAVIVVVSISAVTLITMSAKITNKTRAENEARILISNSLEIFKATDNAGDFENALSILSINYPDEDGIYTYDLEMGGYFVKIKVDFDTSVTSVSRFHGWMIDEESGRIMLDIRYEKGAVK